ncbi:UDP-N-acetylmuramoylalanine-D-glutamate ligase [Leptospirillum ferriphilum ML-04]|uniref:UDP-N-acetylmuramoylalanine-D-glutamate ligase n=1 Tax=Leptospirillum ferriphilum (strain ML-04) TaxID=1048260 RepID=J9Z973_LEPFM|nr:UDP-N-acetylmuramoylalanine-D-glutamate ligase [Leptospirillum ferriphilum ML-04]
MTEKRERKLPPAGETITVIGAGRSGWPPLVLHGRWDIASVCWTKGLFPQRKKTSSGRGG